MTQELVSIIIPTFNRFTYLIRSIDSILNGTWKHVEIIVVDDCSTQQEYKELPVYYENEPRVKIIRLEKNMREFHNSKFAQGMTRNEGLKIARGDWIAFLDDDDFYYTPDKLEKQIQAMKSLNLLGCCTNMVTGRGLDKNTYKEPYFTCSIGSPIQIAAEGLSNVSIINLQHIQSVNYINNSTVIIHKSIREKAGLLELIICEDYEYWKKCLKYTDFVYLNECTVGYDISHAGGSYYVYSQ